MLGFYLRLKFVLTRPISGMDVTFNSGIDIGLSIGDFSHFKGFRSKSKYRVTPFVSSTKRISQ